MKYHSLLSSSANTPVQTQGQNTKTKALCLETFVSAVYLPHICQYKRSWRVDERIARQHLSPFFGTRRLTEIDREKVDQWLRDLLARGLAPATCNRILSVFKSICSLAVTRGILPAGRTPCSGVLPFRLHNHRERYLSPDEARKLIRELKRSPRQEAVVIRLLLLTGARKSEILRAKWTDVHLDQRLLTVPLSKSNKPRHIPLSDESIKVIRSIPRQKGSPWLFPGRVPGKPLSDVFVFWDQFRRKLGLADVRIHDLRHTFASFLVNAGRTLYEVQKLLGHSDPRTTMRYAHLAQASLLAAAQTISLCLSPLRKVRTRQTPRRFFHGKVQSGRPGYSADRWGTENPEKSPGSFAQRSSRLDPAFIL